LQVQAVLDGVRSLLRASQHISPDSVRVRFLRFGLSSFDVEAFAYVQPRDWITFLGYRFSVLIPILVAAERDRHAP
jgi:hypothetical protein